MRRIYFPIGPKADGALALDADAASAGLALACVYSSSDEYEAEVIRARREAGVYGPRRQWRHALVALAVAMLPVILLVLVVRL
jgi:hypothetical protein